MYNAQGFAGRGGTTSPAATSGYRGGPSSPGGADRQGGSGTQQQGGARRATQPIRPVTIKQLLQSSHVVEGAIVVDGREASQVTVVGRIASLENGGGSAGGLTAKHHGYYITDGTGTLLVRQWLDQQDPTATQPLPLQSFVRASGTLKMWSDLPLVTGSVRLVVDSSEITFHLLDSILTHLRITKGPIPSVKQQHGSSPSNPYASAAGAPQGTKPMLPDLIVQAIKGARSPNGMTVQEIGDYAQRFNYSVQEVRGMVRALVSEGKIYQMDSEHYGV